MLLGLESAWMNATRESTSATCKYDALGFFTFVAEKVRASTCKVNGKIIIEI